MPAKTPDIRIRIAPTNATKYGSLTDALSANTSLLAAVIRAGEKVLQEQPLPLTPADRDRMPA